MLASYLAILALLPGASQQHSQAQLEVSPHTCIQVSEAKSCAMEIEVTASSHLHQSLCIVIELAKLKRQCFQANQISAKFQVSLTKNASIVLTTENGEVLATKLLSMGKLSSKDYRVRRRFGWGI